MEKIKKRNSLKWRILFYIPIPFVIAILGTYVIGYGSNDLQTLYQQHFFSYSSDEVYEIMEEYTYEVHYDSHGAEQYITYKDEDGNINVMEAEGCLVPNGALEEIGYRIISGAQLILIPLWIVFCFLVGSYCFYKRELENGLATLMKYSEKIAQNELEFEMEQPKPNEIGLVCESFEKMRKSLLDTSKENIRMSEEARRLNAAFSHDIRTPITVMKGYVDLLEKYIPEGKVSKEKELEILGLMHHQVDRLENYAQSMSSVQKLEDLTPSMREENVAQLFEEIKNTCHMIDERVTVTMQNDDFERKEIYIDKELLFEVIENIVSNASRYARTVIEVNVTCGKEFLEISVRDDGEGFSEKILEKAGNPFLREDKLEDKQHFGLGIYISKMLCEKCGGMLSVENRNGALVKMCFAILKK